MRRLILIASGVVTGASCIIALTIAACDSTTQFEGCSADAALASPGSQHDKCPLSTFPVEDYRAREVSGVVRRGTDTVEGALVRVEPWPDLATTKAAAIASTVTDSVGFFGGLRPVALRYDITAKLGSDVVVFRGVANRYVEPSLETGPHKFPRGWTSHITVTMDAPVRTDRAIAFFGNGDGIFGLTGDLASGLDVVSREFTSTAIVHAIEYVKGAGFDTAMGYARLELGINGSATTLAVMHIDPIATFTEPSFAVTVPPGFLPPNEVDVTIGFTPQNEARLTTFQVGVKKKIPIIPNAGYLYHARTANADGAISDSGQIIFDPYAAVTSMLLPTPPVTDSPASIAANEPLVASGTGVLEHVLAPDIGGEGSQESTSTIRIIVKQRDARLPDLAVIGGAAMHGNYRWSVRSYESLRFVEELGGQDVRRYRSMAVSKPRVIEIR